MATKKVTRKMSDGGMTSKTRNTLFGGTRTKTVDNATGKVTITKRNAQGTVTKQKTRNAVKGWSEDEYKKGGVTKDKNWIQKAVNPAHKGYCTPMSKPTCTPKRKALARTFKAMAKKR